MAYNNYPYGNPMYPQASYPTQPNAYNALNSQMSVGATQQQNVGIPPVQDGGFVTIPNVETAYTYPVAIGKCVTFKVEGKPIIIEKSVYSQFEAPRIEKYRLVKEDTVEEEKVDTSGIEDIRSELDKLWGVVNEIKTTKRNTPKSQSKDGDD